MIEITSDIRHAFISRSSFKVHCGDKFNRCLVDITLKSRKMVNQRLLVIIKLLIEFFVLKHGKLEEPLLHALIVLSTSPAMKYH